MVAGSLLVFSRVRDAKSSSLPRENAFPACCAKCCFTFSQCIGHTKLDIEEAVIDRTAFDGDHLRPRCYTPAGKARHTLSHGIFLQFNPV